MEDLVVAHKLQHTLDLKHLPVQSTGKPWKKLVWEFPVLNIILHNGHTIHNFKPWYSFKTDTVYDIRFLKDCLLEIILAILLKKHKIFAKDKKKQKGSIDVIC